MKSGIIIKWNFLYRGNLMWQALEESKSFLSASVNRPSSNLNSTAAFIPLRVKGLILT